jgi:hypothetical protein
MPDERWINFGIFLVFCAAIVVGKHFSPPVYEVIKTVLFVAGAAWVLVLGYRQFRGGGTPDGNRN